MLWPKGYSEVLKLQKEGKVMDKQAISEIATKHKEEENKLVKSYGPMATLQALLPTYPTPFREG